jgi:undecaprenyl-diphosphatase
MTAWLRPHLDWLRARDLRLLTGLAAIGVLLVIFVEIARAVAGDQTRGFDEAILLALRTAPDDPIGPPSLTAAVMHLSALGSGAVTGLVVLIATVFFALAGRWRYALLMLACSLGTLAGMVLFKGVFERARPTVVMHIDPPGGHSFPSGHSMISAALYLTLAVLIARTMTRRRLRAYVVAAGALLTMLVGFTRLYLGVHYPTDVLAGWTLGALLAIASGLVVSRLGKRDVAVSDG